MKKKIYILLVLAFISMEGFAQLVVTDPGQSALTATTNSIQTVSQTIQKIMASSELELLDTSLFDNISTIMEILEYIDQIACQTSELKFNYRYLKRYSCLTMLNMKSVTMNINYASQIMSKLFAASVITTMSKEGRIKSLTDVLAILKQTSNELGNMNITISGYVSRKIAQDYLNNANFQVGTHSVGNRYR